MSNIYFGGYGYSGTGEDNNTGSLSSPSPQGSGWTQNTILAYPAVLTSGSLFSYQFQPSNILDNDPLSYTGGYTNLVLTVAKVSSTGTITTLYTGTVSTVITYPNCTLSCTFSMPSTSLQVSDALIIQWKANDGVVGYVDSFTAVTAPLGEVGINASTVTANIYINNFAFQFNDSGVSTDTYLSGFSFINSSSSSSSSLSSSSSSSLSSSSSSSSSSSLSSSSSSSLSSSSSSISSSSSSSSSKSSSSSSLSSSSSSSSSSSQSSSSSSSSSKSSSSSSSSSSSKSSSSSSRSSSSSSSSLSSSSSSSVSSSSSSSSLSSSSSSSFVAGKTWNANTSYFDDTHDLNIFDYILNFDSGDNTILTITETENTVSQRYIADEVGHLTIIETEVGTENYSQYVDLLRYVPEKFRSSIALQQFLAEAGLMTGSWLGDISDLSLLINPYTVDEQYITYLAGLIGFNFQATPTTPFSQLQRQLIQAVPWYKMKGTYQGYQYIGYSLGLNLNFYDLYTQDYINFIPELWYAGNVGTLPPDSLLNNPPFVTTSTTSLTIGTGTKTLTVGTGLTFTTNQNIAVTNSTTNYMIGTLTFYNSGTGVMVVNVTNAYGSGAYTSWSIPGGFYKSPHFGVQIALTQVYGTGTASYLFEGVNTFNQLTSYINTARPVNTVPQYSLLLVGQTNQNYSTTTLAGNVMTAVAPSFNVSLPGFFDDGTTIFDDPNDISPEFVFDYTDTAFYEGIVTWKLGTGNKGVDPSVYGFALQNVVLTGTISTSTVYSDHVMYTITVPSNTTQADLSELGLYLLNGTLEVGCTFPNISLVAGIQLQIQINVFFTGAYYPVKDDSNDFIEDDSTNIIRG